MRIDDVYDYENIRREYECFIKRYGYIDFEEFMEYEYRELRQRRNFSRSFDFDSVNVNTNTSSEKSNNKSNDSYEYRGFFDSVSIEPMSELDKQTYNRWTKGESLQEKWNKL